MKRTIFYSWQSDLDSKGNRNLIEEALKRALKDIKRDTSVRIQPSLDRDTQGQSGTPSISDSIFIKIASSDIFVADVSLINSKSDSRLTPNPNVLLELGYAITQLGWERIILVQNTDYGTPDQLPFDLRGRRILTYSCPEATTSRSDVRASLQNGLKTALDSALLDSRIDTQLWWGEWKAENSNLHFGGSLKILDVCSSGFFFHLEVSSGANTGDISAYAQLVSPNLAYAKIENGWGDENGEIMIRRESSGEQRRVYVEETASCANDHGLGVQFSGSFSHVPEPLFDMGYLKELELIRLSKLLGSYYEQFKDSFQLFSSLENIDDFSAEVLTGGVRGLFTIMEGIIMIGSNCELWAAYIDDSKVRYFSSEVQWQNDLPKTITKWMSRFQDKKVVFHKTICATEEKFLS